MCWMFLRNYWLLLTISFQKILKFFAPTKEGNIHTSHDFQEFLRLKGIISQRSCPYTLQQNGVAKRKNRHLLDVTHTLLLESSFLPIFGWKPFQLLFTLSTVFLLSNWKINLHITIFIHLVASALFIFLHMREMNFLPNLPSVFS